MSDTIIRNVILNRPTPEANIADVDTWINDTASKLNVTLQRDVLSLTDEEVAKLRSLIEQI